MLITLPVMLVTRSYMRKNGGKASGQDVLLERVGDRAVEMYGPSEFISWLSHLIRSEQAPGQGPVGAS